MTEHQAQACPNCGQTLPSEMGQHADNLLTGRVTCPACGEEVTLREGPEDEAASSDVARAEASPPGRAESGESFAGNETVEGLTEELRNKPT
jgi:uncharacterized Zn finger protein (UPF0148 family)